IQIPAAIGKFVVRRPHHPPDLDPWLAIDQDGYVVFQVIPTGIEDRNGRVIKQLPVERSRTMDPDTAFVVLDMLQGVVKRGTGARVAKLGRPVAGKTGTTNDLADAWFIGLTPEYAAGVWVGRDQRSTLGPGETGGRAAAPIFLYFMQEALKGVPVKEFEAPPGVTFAQIDPETGEFALEDTPNPLWVCFKQGKVGRGNKSEEPPELEDDIPEEHIILIFRDGQKIVIREPLQPDPSAPALQPKQPAPLSEFPSPR
ncbi:MAG: penicillin-binding transpeptidase domain-containing protein, partial [Pseudomonadota bacterium]